MKFLIDRCAGSRIAEWLSSLGHNEVALQKSDKATKAPPSRAYTQRFYKSIIGCLLLQIRGSNKNPVNPANPVQQKQRNP